MQYYPATLTYSPACLRMLSKREVAIRKLVDWILSKIGLTVGITASLFATSSNASVPVILRFSFCANFRPFKSSIMRSDVGFQRQGRLHWLLLHPLEEIMPIESFYP